MGAWPRRREKRAPWAGDRAEAEHSFLLLEMMRPNAGGKLRRAGVAADRSQPMICLR